MGIFSRINKGLKKTRENMSGAIDSMLHGKTEIDDEFYDELEEILVMGDVGCMTASEIILIPGRLKFGDSKNSAPFPSAVVIFGTPRYPQFSMMEVRE